MRQQRNYLILLLTIPLFVTTSVAQSKNADQLLTTFHEKYDGMKSLHAKMKVATASVEQSIELWYNEANSKMITDGMEVLSTPEALIMVNKTDQWISYQPHNPQVFGAQTAQLFQLPLDTLIRLVTKADSQKTPKGFNLQLELSHDVIKSMKMELTNDYVPLTATYQVAQPYAEELLEMQLTYEVFEVDPVLDDKHFATANYIVGDAGGIRKASPAFSNYRLLNMEQ